jgi:predicted O-methyltransferase YrrM
MPGGRSVAGPLRLVDGYLYPHEAVFLYWLARLGPGDGDVVEIGSFRGRSTLCLAAGLRDGGRGRVYAVDPHRYETAQELRDNIAHFGLMEHAELVVEPSVPAAARWPRSVRAIFIDGDHSGEAAAADVSAWSAHLAPGGFLLLHDSTDLNGIDGPRRAARQYCRVGDFFDKVGTIGSITWARRKSAGPEWRPPQYGKHVVDGIMAALKSLRARFTRPGDQAARR